MIEMHSANVATGTTSRRTDSIPNGKLAMWWFLASEIITFGGLISSYLVFRVANPQWAEDAEHLSAAIATLNTLVLLSSSLTMVLAFAAVDVQDHRGAGKWLGLTVVGGLIFCNRSRYKIRLVIGLVSHVESRHGNTTFFAVRHMGSYPT